MVIYHSQTIVKSWSIMVIMENMVIYHSQTIVKSWSIIRL